MAHSEEVRAQAMAALLAGQSVGDVARQFRLPKQTVSRFKAEIGPFLLDHATEEARVRISDLLFSCTSESLAAMLRIAQTCSSAEFLTEQDLRDVAALYREISGFTLRLLEAASAARVN